MLNLDTDHDLGLGIDECNPDWDRRMGVPMAREPAFPIYRKISSTHVFDEFTPGEYEPGRMFCTQYYDEEGYIDDKIEDFLTERDVIYVPLYEHLDRGESKGHIAMGAGTSNRLQSYNHNLAFLKRVAPHVRYIMVGNALCEELQSSHAVTEGPCVNLAARLCGDCAPTYVYFPHIIDVGIAIQCCLGERVRIQLGMDGSGFGWLPDWWLLGAR